MFTADLVFPQEQLERETVTDVANKMQLDVNWYTPVECQQQELHDPHIYMQHIFTAAVKFTQEQLVLMNQHTDAICQGL